jgi:hypothetical protein
MSQHETIQSATDDILGQFCYALGQGAGAIRIQRDAIAALRARYAQPIAAALDRWPALAPNILSFVTQVGRVAALQTTQQGRTAISADDFMYARQLVESRVHGAGERTHGIFAGILCPTVPGEHAPQPANDDETPKDIAPRAPIVLPANRLIH